MRRIALALATLSVAPSDWKELSPLPIGQAGGAAAWLGRELVIAGGTAWVAGEKQFLSATQIYAPATNSWRPGPELPHGLAYGPFIASADTLEVFGGISSKGPVREVWTLNKPSGQWIRSGEAPADILLGSAVNVAGTAYILGGCPDAADLTRCSDAVWKRKESGEWQIVSKLPQGRLALHAAAAVGTDIYVFGGCSTSGSEVRNHDEAWVLDTRSGKWSRLKSLPRPSRGTSAAVVDKSHIILTGGYVESGFSDAVLMFDTVAKTYASARNLPAGLLGAAAVSSGSHIYVAGGEDKARSRSARLFRAELNR